MRCMRHVFINMSNHTGYLVASSPPPRQCVRFTNVPHCVADTILIGQVVVAQSAISEKKEN